MSAKETLFSIVKLLIHVPSPVSRIQCENLLTILRYIGEIILRIFRRSQPLRTSRVITSLIIRFKD